MKPRVIIAGGGYAGLFAAARLRKYSGMNVTLIDANPHFVQRVRLHEYLAGRSLLQLSYRELFQDAGIEFVQGRITALEADQHTLMIENAAGSHILSYDWLLYALGSRTRRTSAIAGLEEACTLDAGPSLEKARTRLAGLPSECPVVILGAGLTGLEAATEIKEAYPQLRVSLLNAGPAFQSYTKGAEMEIRSVLEKLDVKLHEDSRVVRLTADSVHCAHGKVHPSALTINCLGLEVPTLARDSGLRTSESGQIQVDPYLRSLSHQNILALGDAAELDSRSALFQRMACAAACPMGTHAAETIQRLQSGQKLIPFRFGFTGRCVSLGRRAAVIQLVTPRDEARRIYFRGRLAVWIKEMICRGTVKVPVWELRSGLALNRWYQPKDLP